MQTPLVSIIIPTYNRAHLIGETLDSIIAQTYTNWECIVVDDGSTDNTNEVLASYCEKDARFQYHHRPKDRPRGGNAARNYGFQISNGEYVNWFDSDDLMDSNKLKIQLKELYMDDRIDVCFSGFCNFYKDEIFVEPLSLVSPSKDLFFDIVSKKIKINTPSPIWKRGFLSNKKLFNEEILKGQELDFFTRIFFENEINFVMVDHVLNKIRIDSGGSIMRDYIVKYNSKAAESFFKVRQSIQLMVLKKNDIELYEVASNFYLKNILISLKQKDFENSLNNLFFLKNNSINNKYKQKFIKMIIVFKLLKISKGKGYWFFKKHFKL